jgi:hypothetical protein
MRKLMTRKLYLRIAGTIFGAVAILHALRLLLGWSAVIGGYTFPMWFSWVGLCVAGFLAYEGFRLSTRA